jgi:hypothetical protein
LLNHDSSRSKQTGWHTSTERLPLFPEYAKSHHFSVLRQSIWYFPVLFLVFSAVISSCDETDGPAGVLSERPSISDFQVEPSEIRFSAEDGIGDTLVTFRIDVSANLPEHYRLVTELAGIRDRQVRAVDTLQADPPGSGRYTGSFSHTMNTNRFENLVIYVYPLAPDGRISDRVESTITVRGIDTGRPEVLELLHPDAVVIPLPGEPENRFTISAKVTHTISLDNINAVRLELFDRTDSRIFASNMRRTESGNGTEPEYQLYEQDFSINSGNSPENYRVEVHATDIAGTVSDTLRSTLIITR